MQKVITIGDVIGRALEARFNEDGEYPGPHRDVDKNIRLINKILIGFSLPIAHQNIEGPE